VIAKLEKTDLPLSKEQVLDALQVLAKQIHGRYRSLFTLVFVLPESKPYYELFEKQLKDQFALHISVGIGVHLTSTDGIPGVSIVSPPSVHAIKGRKVVVFDAIGNWPVNYVICERIHQMQPQSVEVATLFSLGPVTGWVNPDYVGFEVPIDMLAKDLALL